MPVASHSVAATPRGEWKMKCEDEAADGYINVYDNGINIFITSRMGEKMIFL